MAEAANAAQIETALVRSMPAPDIQLEDLLALAETLRGAGFAIGTQQYIAAHELLIALAARGHLPENPLEWRTLLAPIFCSSRREQEEFDGHFRAWLQRRPALQTAVQAAQPSASGATLREKVRSSAVRRLRAALHPSRLKAELRTRLRMLWQWIKRPKGMAATAAALLLVASAVYLNAKTERTLTGKVINSDTQEPIFFDSIFFAGEMATSDEKGEFSLTYQIRNLDRIGQGKTENAVASRVGYEPMGSRPVSLNRPEPRTIAIKYRGPTQALPVPLATVPPTAGPTPPQPPSVTPIKRHLWPAVIPLALYALWLLWRWWRRKLMLERMQTSSTPRLQQLKLARDGVKLFDSPAFRRAVVELRRHRHVAANDIDVAATVRATIRQAGLFTPSFGRRRALPEYLLLIDRASLQDEQASLGDELARRFELGEIGVERYYFQGDARTCQQGPLAPALTINELAARYPEHRLLVFGDGAGFFDSFSGEPQRWLEQFAQWPERAVITPIEPGSEDGPQWGYREAVLQDHGFVMLPANANGFEVLTAWLNTGLLQEQRGTAAQPFPATLAERPKRWLERRAPRAEEAEALVAQLRSYLGEEGWLWLRACAVYPQVTWELTLYLGARLLGPTPQQREAWAGHLLRLVRLPWFRYGTLPDWLRAELIAQFTPEQEAHVRGVIEDLLRHVLTRPGEAISLELATPPEAESRWRRLGARVRQWWRRRALYRMLQAQSEESPLRDFVFLSFLAGRRLKPLTVQAPKLWERLLFAGGERAFGLQPVTLGVLAVLAAGLLFWWLWLRPALATHEPDIDPPLSVTPTVPPDVSLTPTPIPSPTLMPVKETLSPSVGPTDSPDVAFTPKVMATLIGHSYDVYSVAFSPDGKTLATGSGDLTVRLWDVASRKELATLTGYRGSVYSVAFSPDARTLATGSGYNTVKLWDVASRKELATLTGNSFTALAFSPDGKTLATGSMENTVKLWDVASRKEMSTLIEHTDSVSAVAFSPDGKMLATGSQDRTVVLWDVASGRVRDILRGHAGSVSAVAFSPDAQMLATGSQDGTVMLWDVASGRVRAILKGHAGSVSAVAFSPDAQMLATGSQDRTVMLWDVASGQVRAILKGHVRSVSAVAFSPDGRTLATGSWDATVKLWDVAGRK